MPKGLLGVSSCGCLQWEEYDPPCDGPHDWTHWHPNSQDALREDRYCRRCGAMEWQRLAA